MIMDFLSSDKLGSTVFAPVKMDFVGNIKVRVHVFDSLSFSRFDCSAKEMMTQLFFKSSSKSCAKYYVTNKMNQH